MSSPRTEFFRSRRAVPWLLPTALLALAPKCLLCVAAYAGFGAALGLGGPEICGAAAGAPGSWASSLAWFGGAGELVAIGVCVSCRRSDRMRSGLE